ncbi:MAG: hypothetical protein NTW25_13995 [Candidatus Kapabacteria bacterium]|nr:hypothetical protein [Candidatus Kapabacteria bacterium]
MKNTLIIIIILLFIALIYLFNESNNKDINNQIIKRDTVLKYIEHKPINVNNKKAKIKYIKDTIISTKPYEASLDTIINKDTISLSYIYPDNIFNLNINKSIDTLKCEREIITNNNNKDSNWFDIAIASISGIILGYILGK